MHGRGKRSAVLLVVLLAVTALAMAACGPKTATLKLTIKDLAGKALAAITVKVGDKSAVTDAAGLATIKEVPPGTVTIKLTGDGYDAEKTADVKAGDNVLNYALEPEGLTLGDQGQVTSMRLRIANEFEGQTSTIESATVRGQGVQWKFADAEVIALGENFYIKVGTQAWVRSVGAAGQAMAGAYTAMGEIYLEQFAEFATAVAAGSLNSRLAGSEDANGYACKVWDVGWAGPDQELSYKVWVVATGAYKGLATRWSWEMTGAGSTVMDMYDFGEPIELKAPI